MSRITIDILAHADFHGQFKEDKENPGLSRFFCCIESVRKQNPEYTLLLDAGDESKCLWHGKDVYVFSPFLALPHTNTWPSLVTAAMVELVEAMSTTVFPASSPGMAAKAEPLSL